MSLNSQEKFILKHWKHGLSKSSTYQSWHNMIQRCNNPNTPNYKNYGGRGITVCSEWTDFTQFLKDMGEKPQGYSIERKNNNSGYCPENCIWASKKEQANNRRGNIYVQVNGVKYTVAQFADRFHLNAKQLYAKLNQHRSKNTPNQMNLF